MHDDEFSYDDEPLEEGVDDDMSGDAADLFLKQFEEPEEPEADSEKAAEPAPAAADESDPFAPSSEPDGQLAWRETYFILFDKDARPTLTQVEAAIGDASNRLRIENLQADDDGLFRSVLVQAPEDNAALEISFEAGDAVTEQSTELAKALKDSLDGDQLAHLLRSDARLDVMHFERLADDPFSAPAGAVDDDWGDENFMPEGLDPASLITVVEALAGLTDGLPIDPAAGEVLS